jgi:hypothetical protein
LFVQARNDRPSTPSARDKSLFFCQSRSLTDTVADRMRGRDIDVFVHHSSVSLEERKAAEDRFHHGTNACIVCTSTLELGIDVGDLDLVLQANAYPLHAAVWRVDAVDRTIQAMANATEWARRVAAWRASGMTAEQFCADKGYSVKSLWGWSSRLSRTAGRTATKAGASVPLAKVVSAESVSPRARRSAGPDDSDGRILLEIGGARIEVQGRVDASALRTVVDVLREERA